MRCMLVRDLPTILAMERSLTIRSWGDSEYKKLLKGKKTIGLVVECDHGVIGGVVYQANRDHMEINRFIVHSGWRLQGIGTYMMEELKARLRGERQMIRFPTHEASTDLHLFLKANGFTAKYARSYYKDGDAYIFEYYLPIISGSQSGSVRGASSVRRRG